MSSFQGAVTPAGKHSLAVSNVILRAALASGLRVLRAGRFVALGALRECDLVDDDLA